MKNSALFLTALMVSFSALAGGYKIVGDKYTDGGKRREVWGFCSNGSEFNAAKWNNDDYWTVSGNGKLVQPNGVSLSGAIDMVCD